MQTRKLIKLSVLFLLFGCATTNFNPEYRINAGVNKGGIVENTDFSSNPSVPLDAYTGATNLGTNLGMHTLLPIGKNAIETGVDYMYNKQTFLYKDASYNYYGNRNLNVSQIMTPITFNFGLLRNNLNTGQLNLKIGFVQQYNLLKFRDNAQSLPEYNFNKWSNGLTFGLSTIPFALNNGNFLGFYIDLYRGSKIYNDLYNNNNYEMPGSAYLKGGIIYHISSK